VLGDIWVGIVSEIWNHRNEVVFWEWMGTPSGGFYFNTKENLVLDHGKRKVGCFLLLWLVFGTSMLYEVFERLIFGVSYLMFVPRFWSCGVFCAVFLGSDGLMCLSWVEIGSCLCFVQVFLVMFSYRRIGCCLWQLVWCRLDCW